MNKPMKPKMKPKMDQGDMPMKPMMPEMHPKAKKKGKKG